MYKIMAQSSLVKRKTAMPNNLRRRSLAELDQVLDEIAAQNPVEMKKLEDYIEEQIRKANNDRISSRS